MLPAARFRAEALAKIRAFFSGRGVLEVETPLLSRGASHDCHIGVFAVPMIAGESPALRYLQTSPEPHMKRLLARGFPDIFQTGKAFRLGERGRLHNPEFTLVEWYRRGFSLRKMMEETVEVCRLVAGAREARFASYREVFRSATGMDPLSASRETLLEQGIFSARGFDPKAFPRRADALNFLMSELVEPSLDPEVLTVVHGFPADLSSQALPDPEVPGTALRFEVFGGGVELGNGYEELTNPGEYRKRFEEENRIRVAMGKPAIPLDEGFFTDLKKGLPACAGTALGLDRLLMLGLGKSAVDAVLDFPWEKG